eukprot:TRINITY_DN8918_c0_g1_i1.p1 TRINITY_DN8918_c0_g1~~TRINITY_DN8918_c0_g1_i1.p1  ORF type:complete len:144 (+),score=46.19 TRINITY_DN8918_c0_g1_i1:38-469(+)
MSINNYNNSDNDLFDNIINIEDNFYKNGFKNGEVDGQIVGIEHGRDVGFVKGVELGREIGRIIAFFVLWSSFLIQNPTYLKENQKILFCELEKQLLNFKIEPDNPEFTDKLESLRRNFKRLSLFFFKQKLYLNLDTSHKQLTF